ncbi:MAG: nitroreductase family protein [Candidatus Bathyarchaeota archaeon]|nr:nitroreductase family protein [Candidatus Bathyarchaeota archaeon]
MDLSEAISKRRSIRNFKDQPLPAGTVEKLIDAARKVPSAGNLQPWEFVVVSKAEHKKMLFYAARAQTQMTQASVVIVVCVNQHVAQQYGSRGINLYCIQDASAAVENLMLTAVSLGLGACWIGAFQEDEVAKIVKAPEGLRPVAMVTVGFPNEMPPERPKRALSEVMHKETF